MEWWECTDKLAGLGAQSSPLTLLYCHFYISTIDRQFTPCLGLNIMVISLCSVTTIHLLLIKAAKKVLDILFRAATIVCAEANRHFQIDTQPEIVSLTWTLL